MPIAREQVVRLLLSSAAQGRPARSGHDEAVDASRRSRRHRGIRAGRLGSTGDRPARRAHRLLLSRHVHAPTGYSKDGQHEATDASETQRPAPNGPSSRSQGPSPFRSDFRRSASRRHDGVPVRPRTVPGSTLAGARGLHGFAEPQLAGDPATMRALKPFPGAAAGQVAVVATDILRSALAAQFAADRRRRPSEPARGLSHRRPLVPQGGDPGLLQPPAAADPEVRRE